MISIRIKNRLCPNKYRVRELPQFLNHEEKKQYFDLIIIDNWDGILQYIEPLLNEDNSDYIFRGVNNAAFKMFSSVQRQWYWNGYDAYFRDIPSYIKYQIGRFRSNKYLMDNNCSDNDYNILAMIQHYEGKSNLIDFSYQAKSALFFAWNDHQEQFPNDGSLNDYVSLYMINYTHPILIGPIEVSQHGADSLERYASGLDLPPENIDAKDVLKDLEKMPYNTVYDGKIVHGGLKSITDLNVPFFDFRGSSQISNANLAAQNGCFIQAPSDETPLEAFFKHRDRYVLHLIRCYDIHKSLVEKLCADYRIPTNSDMIYPHKKAAEKMNNEIKNLDKYVPLKWMVGKISCRSL